MKATTLLDLIGNTPLIQVKQLNTGLCDLFIKLEHLNPGGSIKDRIAHKMITHAESCGQIKPGDLLIEATAGNTGVSLAQVAQLKGYKLLLVIPDKMSKEKIDHLIAMGVEVIITRSDVSKGHPEYYQDLAETLSKTRPNAFYINQFANPNNANAHEETTAPEIWRQMHHQIDAIVCGAGTGGHLTGISRFMASACPKTKIILADPIGSILAQYIRTGKIHTKKTSWLVEGIGEDYIPPNCNTRYVSQAYRVKDIDAFKTAHLLLRKEGIFAGSSSGATIWAALCYCREQKKPKRVVTFTYDSGNKYLSKMYNKNWLQAHHINLNLP